MADWSFARVYSDRTHVYTTTVRHQGTTIAFAMDDQRRIRYAVLDLSRSDVKEGSPDSDYWPKDPSDLAFPTEITTVGFAAAGNVRMPTVKKGGRAEPAAPVLPEDVDPFLSTTARLTARAPFQVVSDGTHVVVFRQSIDRAHADAVFVLQSGDASGDPARTDYAAPESAVVDSALLCDRFVLAGSTLVPLSEVRYRRSRDRARPSSRLDTPGNSDMDGNPFVEPTHLLSFVKNLSGGAFAVLLLPTAVAGVSRWQVFARNGTTNRIDSFSVEQGADGLFHTQGTQLYTSPDPQYRSSVLERAPGKDPLSGRDLVPVIDTTGMAETALRFDGTGCVNLGSPAPLQLKGTPYTIEAWVKPAAPNGAVLAQGTPGQPTGYTLSIDANGMLVHAQAGGSVTSTTAVGTGTFRHVAAVFDGSNTTLYVDGAAAGSGALAALQPETTLPVLIGAAGAAASLASPFQGDVDEVRVWNRAVSATDIALNRYHRLVGSETGLIGYWRFDEGSGTTVYDETDSGTTGTLAGGATWVTSTAGVGDGPGLSRETFALAGRTIVSGLAAELYYQQEQAPTGYEGKAQPLKKQARVLLACATAASPAQAGDRPYVAALDFAVGRDGRLAQVPMQVTLSTVDRPAASSDSAALATVQQQLTAVQARIDANNASIAAEGPNERDIAIFEPLRGLEYWRYGWFLSIPPAEVESRLAACYAKRAQAQQARVDNATAYGELRVLQDRLAFLTLGLQGSDDVGLPMPFLGLDTVGLSVYGGLLAFAWTQDAPFLMDGATGDLTMYFRGGDGQFFAAYYDTNVLRGSKKLDAAGKPVRLLARDPAIATSSVTLTVSAGSADDRCNVTIVHPSTTETFKDVPRAADQLAAVLNGRSATYAYATAATTTRPGATVAHGSQLLSADAGGATTRVGDGTAADDLAGQTVRWHASAAGRAFTFDGQAQRLALPGTSFDGVAAPGDVTVEAWVNPSPSGQACRVLHANAGDAKYALGLAPATMQAALSFNGTSDWLECGSGLKVGPGDFTVEAWVQRKTSSWMNSVLDATDPPTSGTLVFGFVASDAFAFNLVQDVGAWGIMSPGSTDLGWHHWAGVYVRASHEMVLYCDGVPVARSTADRDYGPFTNFRIANSAAPSPACVNVDEVRVWGRARTAEQIKATFDRRVTGNEPGLLAYWMFAGGQTADLSGNGNDMKPTGKPAAADSPPRLPGYRAQAGIGSIFVRSKDVFPTNQWGHLAVSYRQDWAARLDGNAYLDVAHDEQLNLGAAFTVEVFFRLDSIGSVTGSAGVGAFPVAQGLLTKGSPGAGLPGWSLFMLPNGLVSFEFASATVWGATGVPVNPTRSQQLQPGTFNRVAVVRKSVGVVNGALTDQIRVLVNGQELVSQQYQTIQVATGTAPLEIGRRLVGDQTYGLRGVLGEVRIWNVALEDKDLGKPVNPKAKGLVARWDFPENAGNTTLDSTGQYRATFHGAKWVRNPDAQASTLQLYHNGAPAASEALPANDAFVQAGFGDQQFTLAGRTAGGTLADGFAGTLDEVRVWRTARGQLDILGNLFSRLDSKPADLLAYYPFDAASTAAGAIVRDAGPRGNDLRAADGQFPRVVASTAPLSGDVAATRSALTGLVTAFCERIGATPAAGEYATVQRTRAGVTGTMKRCYSYVRAGAWRLVAGYQVGELVSDWVGQVQRDPQLYGYIEGAPPMPSENLTDASANPSTQDFANASKVTFTQTDKVTSALHSGSEDKREWAAKLTAELTIAFGTSLVTAPLGIGTAEKPAVGKIKIGGSLTLAGTNGWIDEVDVSQGVSRTRSTVVGLNGQWEDPARVAFAGAGRRYVPDNTGFAVVRAETADVYALRLARNRSLVALRMLPNPDIPRDWNIITFPINPRYVKQGTLDGAIGYDASGARALDPSYPMAATPGDFSYYRPREAYALKRRIEQERHRIKALYDSAYLEGRALSGQADRAREQARQQLAKITGQDIDVGEGVKETPETDGMSRRNLANTYVWTAAGGFFAETTDTTDVVTETAGGSWSFSATGTFSVSGGVDSEFGGGFNFGLELTAGGTHSETKTRKTETEEAFTLAVECAPGRALGPGRVDAYRFMTFYLDSTKDNFEDFYGKVVDPVWLTQSNESNAVALRQTQQSGKKPPCWRILHRVTFVSRVLPTGTAPASATPVDAAAAAVSLASSYDLVRRLEPLVKASATTRASLDAATRSALATLFPALTPRASQIVDFLALYYGVTA